MFRLTSALTKIPALRVVRASPMIQEPATGEPQAKTKRSRRSQMNMKLLIKDDPEAFRERIRALQKLKDTKVKVGLPDSAGGQLHFILAVQQHGSPIMHIPARPVVQPALHRPDTRSAMAEEMRNAVQAAWEGEDPRPSLEAAGQKGADGIREYIDSGIPPPNSPVTVSGGWIWNRAARKGVYVAGKGFNQPLVDTGALYDSFDYELEE